MLKNAYLLAKIGADTAENEQHFAEICQKLAIGSADGDRRGRRAALAALAVRAGRRGARGDPVGAAALHGTRFAFLNACMVALVVHRSFNGGATVLSG